MINLHEVQEQVIALALNVGKMQKESLGRKDLLVDTKSTGIDLVTEIDKKSEEAIIHCIKTNYPTHDILAEESGLSACNSDYRWIVDPLDGTTNYAHGLPIFSISIALQFKGETVLGVVYTPVTDQLFTAMKGQGAYLNGERLSVSMQAELAESVLATGFPYDVAEHPENNVSYFSGLILKTRAIRRMGAAAYDLACVAAGKFDGFWELKLSPWDVAAATLMVEEAGGKVISFRDDRGVSIIAGNEVICQKIHEEIKRIDAKRKL